MYLSLFCLARKTKYALVQQLFNDSYFVSLTKWDNDWLEEYASSNSFSHTFQPVSQTSQLHVMIQLQFSIPTQNACHLNAHFNSVLLLRQKIEISPRMRHAESFNSYKSRRTGSLVPYIFIVSRWTGSLGMLPYWKIHCGCCRSLPQIHAAMPLPYSNIADYLTLSTHV